MKKLVAITLTILSCGMAYALPLGNPAEASMLCDGIYFEGPCYSFCQPGITWCNAFSFRFGFYGDYVFNRHLECDENHIVDDIEDTELFTNAAYLVANYWDKLDFFVTLGASNFRICTNAFTFNGPNSQRFVLESETDFSWSVGVRLTFLQLGCTTLGAEGQYFFTKPHVTRVTVGDTNSNYPPNFIKLKYQEWQFGFGVSHRIWNLVPYVGAKACGVKVDFGDALIPVGASILSLPDLDNRFIGGFVIGVSLVDCDRMALTVEARYPDEKALYANGQIRF